MCGIGGIRNFGNEPITGEELTLMLCSLEKRGQHATGLALWDRERGLHVHKAAEPAWQFTKDKQYNQFLKDWLDEKTEIALLHTRWATVGSPEDNRNNHPITDGETVIVHNGGISNHWHLFQQGKYKRACETDSDIIRAIIAENGMNEKGIRELGKMAGSAAIAVLSTKEPGRLLLARSGSPLVYGFSASQNKLYWASEPEAIFKAARPWHQVRGAWVQDTHVNISIGSMPDNTAWVFSPDELVLHGRFPVCSHYSAPDYSRGRISYHQKTKDWKKRAKEEKERAEATAKATTKVVETKPTVIQGASIKRPVTNVLALPAKSKTDGDEKPMKNSVMQCDSCGEPVMNINGVPWSLLDCPRCNNRVFNAD